MTTRLHNYAEVRAYLGKEHLDWLRAFTPGLNAPADYWPQKVLGVSQRTPRCRTPSASVSTKLDLIRRWQPFTVRRRSSCATRCRPTTFRGNSLQRQFVPSFPMTWSSTRYRFHSMPWSLCCRKGLRVTRQTAIVLFSWSLEPPREKPYPSRSETWTSASKPSK